MRPFSILLAYSIASSSILLVSVASAQEPSQLGNRREIFVDRHMIQSTKNVQLRLKTPRDEGVALKLDREWESRFSGYTTVIKDSTGYKMYYRGMPAIGAREVTCLATSKDGKVWTRPKLTLYESGDVKETNIVVADVGSPTHNFCPMLDRNPNCESAAKYKAIGGSAKTGLFAFQSADGIRWEKMQQKPVLDIGGWVFDSQNLAFWSETEKQYVMYFRRVLKGVRAIAKSTSKDFVNWSKPVQMRYSDTKSEIPRFQLYTNQTQPYYRAPHILVATAARFMPGRRTISAEQAKAIGVDPKYYGDVSDAVLLTSRGGTQYDVEFQTALLRPGIGAQNWVSRTNYPALGIVPTGKNEMSLFVNQNYGQQSAHVHRYSFRIDGLACAEANLNGGELLTKPFTMSGNQLELNYSTSAAG